MTVAEFLKNDLEALKVFKSKYKTFIDTKSRPNSVCVHLEIKGQIVSNVKAQKRILNHNYY